MNIQRIEERQRYQKKSFIVLVGQSVKYAVNALVGKKIFIFVVVCNVVVVIMKNNKKNYSYSH